MEVEDRGVWFEDREVGMECWRYVVLRFCQSMDIKKAEGSCEFLRFFMWRLPTLPLAQYHRRDGA